ncbi:MAG: inorganic phosphate transporter [Candidatus Melainabacteria bacterium]|nr:inorganic phosphate transporter [Candidatus Melainabacteria bacterium]
MHVESFLALVALALAYTFDFVNGFHDTANAVATVIYTKALRPNVAILMSGTLNFLGCLLVGTAVAQVITEVIPRDQLSLPIILATLLGSLIWNIFTWYYGIPVSSSHCLIGGLFGAGIAEAGVNGVTWSKLVEVLTALAISPIAGFVGGLVLAAAVDRAIVRVGLKGEGLRQGQPQFMRWLQIMSSAAVSFTHGSNDGQKTMGIIAIVLATQFPGGGYTLNSIPLWVIVTAAFAIGLGTMIGGWRVIRTVGTKISRERLQYTHGFAAEFSTAAIILTASLTGAPISTTHTLSSAVAGGTVTLHGLSKLNLRTIKLIFSAWILTLPVAFLLGAICCLLLKLAGLR